MSNVPSGLHLVMKMSCPTARSKKVDSRAVGLNSILFRSRFRVYVMKWVGLMGIK